MRTGESAAPDFVMGHGVGASVWSLPALSGSVLAPLIDKKQYDIALHARTPHACMKRWPLSGNQYLMNVYPRQQMPYTWW